MIKFRCANCQRKIGVKNDWSGKTVKCPDCGEVCQVPEIVPDLDESPNDLDVLAQLAAAESQTQATLASKPDPPRPPQAAQPMSQPIQGRNIEFGCVRCGAINVVDAAFRGHQVTCHQCGQINRVPGAPRSVVEAPTRSQSVAKSIFYGCVAILILALTLWVNFNNYRDDATSADISEGNPDARPVNEVEPETTTLVIPPHLQQYAILSKEASLGIFAHRNWMAEDAIGHVAWVEEDDRYVYVGGTVAWETASLNRVSGAAIARQSFEKHGYFTPDARRAASKQGRSLEESGYKWNSRTNEYVGGVSTSMTTVWFACRLRKDNQPVLEVMISDLVNGERVYRTYKARLVDGDTTIAGPQLVQQSEVDYWGPARALRANTSGQKWMLTLTGSAGFGSEELLISTHVMSGKELADLRSRSESILNDYFAAIKHGGTAWQDHCVWFAYDPILVPRQLALTSWQVNEIAEFGSEHWAFVELVLADKDDPVVAVIQLKLSAYGKVTNWLYCSDTEIDLIEIKEHDARQHGY